MKKIVFLILGLAAFAFGADGEMIRSYSVIAGGIGLGLAALGGAIALAMIEAQVIYALVITLIVLYANPMLG